MGRRPEPARGRRKEGGAPGSRRGPGGQARAGTGRAVLRMRGKRGGLRDGEGRRHEASSPVTEPSAPTPAAAGVAAEPAATGPVRAPAVAIIVAYDRGRAIGRGGRLPWHLPEDLRRFRRLTWGATVLMGRRTAESIGRALPGRRNLVLSRGAGELPPGMARVGSLEEAIGRCDGGLLWVIGGQQLYELALPRAERLEITEVDTVVSGRGCLVPRRSTAARGRWPPSEELRRRRPAARARCASSACAGATAPRARRARPRPSPPRRCGPAGPGRRPSAEAERDRRGAAR
ncbi:MAG: dihydrofolate reductase [Xanthomonadales bacterium]|nr:dihydrofolate reductase [Xanthomonadales bacterium]